MNFSARIGAALIAIAFVGAGVAGVSCTGDAGALGPAGPAGDTTVAEAGAPGAPGQPGANGGGADGGLHEPYNPGSDVKLVIDSAAIDATSIASVKFHLTDGNTVPLLVPITSDGRFGTLVDTTFTPAPISVSFVLAWLGQTGATPGYYTPYTTRAVDGGTPKASVDTGGMFALSPADGDGYYTYTFGTKITVADGTKTHTVGAYAVRTIPGLPQPYVSNAEYNFLPAGGAVTTTREVVLRENCNQCHNDLGHHGSANNARKDIQLCILCHNPATTDLGSQNTINFGTMVHKIHSGASLPSVAELKPDGTPLYPYGIGSGSNFDDYSDVRFPQDVGNCAKCHAGAKDTAVYLNPTLAACTSCHDRTYFGPAATPPATPASTKWTLHKLGTPIDPNVAGVCKTCHDPGGLADPVRYHHVKTTSVALKIVSAGFTPPPNSALQVVFDLAVTDNTVVPAVTTHGDTSKLGVFAASRGALSLVLGGPTADFSFGHDQNNRFNVFSGKASAVNGTLSAPDAATKYLTFTTTRADFDTTLTATGLTGSWGVGLIGSAQAAPVTINGAPVTQATYYAPNDILYFNAADGSPAKPATPIVEASRCNTCHEQIPGHGGSRNDPRLCQFCHQPSQSDTNRPGNLAATIGATAEGQPVDFKVFIHDIHLGSQRTPGNISWYGGTDFTNLVQYPDKLNNCQHCHMPGTYALPQVAATVQPTQTTTHTCNAAAATCTASTITATSYMAPNKAVCTSCHDSVSAATHTTIMSINPGASAPQSSSNPSGYAESCDTCHGVGRQFDVVKIHALQ